MAGINHWDEYHRLWSRLGPPLRPDAAIAARIARAIDGKNRRVLLLGVTPEYADIGDDLTAVDINPQMVDHIWPGNTPRRRALHGTWLDLPFPDGRFTAVIGDGSPNTLQYPDDHHRLAAELTRVVQPGGCFAARVYARPAVPQPVRRICQDVLAGRTKEPIHSFKWRLATALAGEAANANLPVASILEAFNTHLPDRPALQRATGWTADDFATIDIYSGSTKSYSFPTEEEFRNVYEQYFTNLRWQPDGGFGMFDPLLTMDFRSK